MTRELEQKERATRHAPRALYSERTCIITREALPKEALIRFVVSPEGVLVPDLAGKLPGRGMYVSCSRVLVAEAIAKKAFSRAAKQQVRIPEAFLERLDGLMQQRVLDALSMARKAGQVLAGFDVIDAACRKNEVAALMHTQDAGTDGVKKLRFFEGPIFQNLPKEALCSILGRENPVHVAIAHGPAAAFFITEARRFALFLE